MPELPRGMDPSVREPLGPQTPTGSDLAYESILAPDFAPTDTASSYRAFGTVAFPICPSWRAFRRCVRKLGTEAALATFTAIQNDLVGGFLDRHVKGVPSDFPTRVRAAHPELIVQDLSWLRERAQAENRLSQ